MLQQQGVGHITAPPAPEVEQMEKEGVGQGGLLLLVEGRMQQEGKTVCRVCLELLQWKVGARESVHLKRQVVQHFIFKRVSR